MLFDLVIKDLKLFLYDKKTLAVFLVMPIVLMTILGISLSDIFTEDSGSPFEQIRLGVVKNYNVDEELIRLQADERDMLHEGGEGIDEMAVGDVVDMDAIFFRDFLGQEQVQEWVTVFEMSEDEMDEAIEADKIDAAIVMPEGYVYNGGMTMMGIGRRENTIHLIINPEHSIKGEVIQGIINGFISEVNRQKAQNTILIGDLMVSNKMAFIESVFLNEKMQETPAMDIEVTNIPAQKGTTMDSFQYYAVAIMSMFVLYAASFSGFGMRREKTHSTLSRAYVQGISINLIIISNFIKTLLLVMIQMSVMILYSYIVLGVQWGNPIILPLNMFLIGAVVGAMGSLLSLIGLAMDSDSVIKVFEMVIIQFMALIGGSFIPIDVLPDAISHLKFLSIPGLSIELFTNGMMGQPINQLIGTWAIIVVYTLVALLIVWGGTGIMERRWRTC